MVYLIFDVGFIYISPFLYQLLCHLAVKGQPISCCIFDEGPVYSVSWLIKIVVSEVEDTAPVLLNTSSNLRCYLILDVKFSLRKAVVLLLPFYSQNAFTWNFRELGNNQLSHELIFVVCQNLNWSAHVTWCFLWQQKTSVFKPF